MPQRRLIRLFLVSVAICGVFGPLFGPGLMAVLIGEARLPVAVDNAGLPFYVYSLRAVGPFGAAAGIAGAVICLGPLRLDVAKRSFTSYIVAVCLIGMVLGSAVPLYYVWRDAMRPGS